jgi:endonuclease YncB( thermonuclease family)
VLFKAAGLWTLVLSLELAAGLAVAGDATVLSVGDGDTLTVIEGQHRIKVRLACIDAPETAQSPYGAEARKALQTLTPVGSPVTVRRVATDRYGRTVGEVFRASHNVNLTLVRGGYAFVYRYYLQNCDRNRYLNAEREAEASRRGVWSVPGGLTRPWDWRRGGRSLRQSGGQPPQAAGSLRTDRYTCKQIRSWSRAQQLLREGHTYLDRDNDGEACESLK